MAVIDQIQNAIDAARGKLDTMGFRPRTVILRTEIVVTPGDPVLGTPPVVTNDDLQIAPRPVVERATPEDQELFGLMFQSGDIIVSKISRSSTYEARVLDKKTIWVVTGVTLAGEYQRVDGELDTKNTEHVVLLRRRQ